MMAYALSSPAALSRELPLPGRRTPQRPMNEARFEELYRRNARDLWSYAYRLIGDAASADDLLQKAFFHFLRCNPAVESDEHARRYLFRTVTNLAFDHFRESKRDRSAQPREEPVASAEGREWRHDVKRLFGELKPRERALLWLAHVEEATHEDIGEALGLKSGSVRVLLFRARKRLADILMRNGIGPEVPR